jgi:hypothetical protein
MMIVTLSADALNDASCMLAHSLRSRRRAGSFAAPGLPAARAPLSKLTVTNGDNGDRAALL